MLEERKYPRIETPQNTRALAHDNIAQVVDISKSGLSLLFLDNKTDSITGEFLFDVLYNKQEIDIRQIPGEIVWSKEVSFSATPGMVYKKTGVKFGNLSPSQQKSLITLFIVSNTMCD
ncbi:MAG: PilZ domain-containing protein [Desulfocapsa sp.]|nr:PilZ domain-containing protein [Desulfocapsa sp.]